MHYKRELEDITSKINGLVSFIFCAVGYSLQANVASLTPKPRRKWLVESLVSAVSSAPQSLLLCRKNNTDRNFKEVTSPVLEQVDACKTVSYTHLTLPTTPYV